MSRRLRGKSNIEIYHTMFWETVSTSGMGMKFYNNNLIKLLESKRAMNKGSFACKGSFIAKEFSDKNIFHIIGKLSQGHPNDKDFKKAERFIIRVVDSL